MSGTFLDGNDGEGKCRTALDSKLVLLRRVSAEEVKDDKSVSTLLDDSRFKRGEST